jgi:hypothetical protein
LIYDAGRESPRPELVAKVLRPLRGKLSARLPTVMTLREILDGIIIAYTSFCLEGDKKAPGDSVLIAGWHLSDPGEIWLEALARTGQGHRIDLLPVPPAALAPEIFPQRNWLLVTSGKLTAARKSRSHAGGGRSTPSTLSPSPARISRRTRPRHTSKRLSPPGFSTSHDGKALEKTDEYNLMN